LAAEKGGAGRGGGKAREKRKGETKEFRSLNAPHEIPRKKRWENPKT